MHLSAGKQIPIPRPTETAAIGLAIRSPQPRPAPESLWDGVAHALAVDDMNGLAIFARALTRSAGGAR